MNKTYPLAYLYFFPGAGISPIYSSRKPSRNLTPLASRVQIVCRHVQALAAPADVLLICRLGAEPFVVSVDGQLFPTRDPHVGEDVLVYQGCVVFDLARLSRQARRGFAVRVHR
jgi:hypothetical protein